MCRRDHHSGWGNRGTGSLAGVRPKEVASAQQIQHALVVTSHPPTQNPHFLREKKYLGGVKGGQREEKICFTHTYRYVKTEVSSGHTYTVSRVPSPQRGSGQVAPRTPQNPLGRFTICPRLYTSIYMCAHDNTCIIMCTYVLFLSTSILLRAYTSLTTHMLFHDINIYMGGGLSSGPRNQAGMPTSASTGVASPYPRPSPALAETGCCTRGVFLRGDKEDNFTHPEPTASPRRARSQSGGTKAKRLRPTRPVGTWGFS